jgi:hypothetical protein
MRLATAELSWLLSRHYPVRSSLKLVGDRHLLTERQRVAVARAACSDERLEQRRGKCNPLEAMKGESIAIDGFNLIITVEAALSGGVLILGRDGCIRDMSSVHGSYRAVQETEEAVALIGDTLSSFDPAAVEWLLDSPISNSGRLAEEIRARASERGWPWTVDLVLSPDPLLAASDRLVVTTDSMVLDRAKRWVNLARYIIAERLRECWMVDLSSSG